MENKTALDTAHTAMIAASDDGQPRRAFYQTFADSDLFVLLEKEAADGKIAPQILTVENETYILVFDTEERLAEFADTTADHAVLNGRAVASMLVGQGIGLGLNLGVASSSFLMPAEAIEWVHSTLDHAPETVTDQATSIDPPSALPKTLLIALENKLARTGGLADFAYLAAFTYDDAPQNTLVFINAIDQAQPALAQAVNEAVVFIGQEGISLDVLFLDAQNPVVAALEKIGLRIDLPKPEKPEPFTPKAPGKDPNTPPILR